MSRHCEKCCDILFYVHVYLCRDKIKLCRDKVFFFFFLLKSTVRINLVTTESNYVATNFPTIEMRFDSNFVAIERNNVVT